MRGLKTFISSLLLSAGAAAFGHVPDYFPLSVGNVWIYRTTSVPPRAGAATLTVEVTGYETFDGRTYYELSGYRDGRFWVRNDGEGRIYSYDEKAGVERLWYDFSQPKGAGYLTSLPTCCGRAEVRSTDATKRVAIGLFENSVFQITYPGVFQVGIAEENFLPYVGLVFRTENTGGPASRSLDLVYAKISGVTVLNASGVGFGVAKGPDHVRIFVNNSTGAPLPVVFSSGQTFEVKLKDSQGKVLYRWSEGKFFTQALRPVEIPTGETSWAVIVPDIPGAVAVEAELVTVGPHYQAEIPLRGGK